MRSRSPFMEGGDILTCQGAKFTIKVETDKWAWAASSLTDASHQQMFAFYRSRCTKLKILFTNANQDVFFHCLSAARPATTLFSRSRTRMERSLLGVPAAAAALRCRCPSQALLRTPGVGLDPAPVPGVVRTSGPDCNLHAGAATLR